MLRELPRTITMDNGSVWHPKEGYYFADDERGEIWSEKRQKWMRGGKTRDGYLRVCLQCEEGEHPFSVHRLIWESFNGPIPQGLTINHRIEGEEGKQMNMLTNLEVMTRQDNLRYGTHNERAAAARRNDPNMAKQVYQYTTEGELVEIHPSTREAQRQGFNFSAVSKCCRGERKTHQGFRWSYTPLN